MRLSSLIFSACLLMGNYAAAQSVDRNRVMEYLQDQRYEEAIAYLKPGIDTNSAREVALLAYTYYQAGKVSDAAAAYQKVLLLDSNYVSAHQYLATILMQQDQTLGAIGHFKRIVALQPLNAAAWKQLSFAGFSGHLDDSAFNWLNRAYELKPSDARVVARLAEEWLDRKDYNAADSLLNLFLAKDSGSPVVIMTAARTSFLKKDYLRTLSFGHKLMELNIASPNTFIYVASACYNLQQYQECIGVYEYLKARNAGSENIIYYAALAETQLKHYKESNELLKLCISMALSPSLDNYYSGMAVNYEATANYKPAIASLDTAYYLFHRPLRQYSIGRIYEAHLKNEAVALRYYRKYIQLYKPEATAEEKDIYKYLKARVAK